jgi:predicted GNAT family acetyltransferase
MEIKKGDNCFYLEEGKVIGKITFYESEDHKLVVDHTFVEPEYRGQNYAMELVEKMVEYARSANKKIIPVCPYVAKIFARNQKFDDVWDKE